jgi:hypothetical protein
MKTKVKATAEQVKLAKEFRIPLAQAHTINPQKVEAYRKFKATPEEQINDYLDRRISYV